MTNNKSKVGNAVTPESLQKLEDLAERATPGPWTVGGSGTIILDWEGDREWSDTILARYNSEAKPKENAEYIAAVSPDVVLVLIAEVKELRRELHKTRSLTVEESLRAQLAEAKEVIEHYSYAECVREFERYDLGEIARAYLGKYPK